MQLLIDLTDNPEVLAMPTEYRAAFNDTSRDYFYHALLVRGEGAGNTLGKIASTWREGEVVEVQFSTSILPSLPKIPFVYVAQAVVVCAFSDDPNTLTLVIREWIGVETTIEDIKGGV